MEQQLTTERENVIQTQRLLIAEQKEYISFLKGWVEELREGYKQLSDNEQTSSTQLFIATKYRRAAEVFSANVAHHVEQVESAASAVDFIDLTSHNSRLYIDWVTNEMAGEESRREMLKQVLDEVKERNNVNGQREQSVEPPEHLS